MYNKNKINEYMTKKNDAATKSFINAMNKKKACALFVLDISGSMEGDPISSINRSMAKFKSDLMRDKNANDIVEVAVIVFNEEWQVIQDWCSPSEMNLPTLFAEGGTRISAPLLEANKMVRERTHVHAKLGCEVLKPMIVLISDVDSTVGETMHDIEHAASEVRRRIEADKLNLLTLAVGEYNEEIMGVITEGEGVVEVSDGLAYNHEQEAIKEFFDFATKSVIAVSRSAPGEEIHVDHKIADEEAGSKLKVPSFAERFFNRRK